MCGICRFRICTDQGEKEKRGESFPYGKCADCEEREKKTVTSVKLVQIERKVTSVKIFEKERKVTSVKDCIE